MGVPALLSNISIMVVVNIFVCAAIGFLIGIAAHLCGTQLNPHNPSYELFLPETNPVYAGLATAFAGLIFGLHLNSFALYQRIIAY